MVFVVRCLSQSDKRFVLTRSWRRRPSTQLLQIASTVRIADSEWSARPAIGGS